MAKTRDGQQTDIELAGVDLAARAVREFQRGACTKAYLKARLEALTGTELEQVAIATRLSARSLQTLRE